jgi:hypothetical protein
MAFYIATYLLITMAFFFRIRFKASTRKLIHIFVLLYLAVFIGLRHEVGGDWEAYLYHFDRLSIYFHDLPHELLAWDPGYVLLEFLAKKLGLGIYGVNFFCALVFLSGFYKLLHTLDIRMRDALTVAYPYLIMVVANGYTRQSCALGLTMFVLAFYLDGKVPRSVGFFIVSLFFHKSALFFGITYLKLPSRISRWKSLAVFIFLFFAAVVFFLIFQNYYATLYQYYFKEKMNSLGALIRIMINLVATVALFVFRNGWKRNWEDFEIWKWYGILTCIILLASLYTRATTMGDRLLLYLYPLQISVFPRIEKLLATKPYKAFYKVLLASAYWGVLLVWLLFADHREKWIPYNNLLLQMLQQ